MRAENVGVKIGGKEILRDVSYSFPAKKRTAIIGPNGAGKSTLLKALCLLNEKYTGNISVDGVNIKNVGRKKLAQIMAILPQEREAPQDTTVRQLASFGRFPYRKIFGGTTKEDADAVDWALKVTRLTDFENRQVISLSGGERQRAWLAMTLAQRPQILLLDEPTTYLDIAHQLDVMDIISSVNKNFGMTIIAVLHDINHVRLYTDEVVVIKNHGVFAAGKPKEILTAESIGNIFDVAADTFVNAAGDSVIIPMSISKLPR